MHLTRVQIPEFRALKNVDITFEKDFTPKIFPLGSENGGGKSTLLQLIFVLLYCATNRHHQQHNTITITTHFIKNMLARYRMPEGVNRQTLAKIDIWDGKKTVQIEFFCCNDDFLKSIVSNGSEKYILRITAYSETESLLCQVSNFPLDKIKSFLNELSEKVFLVAPSTQVCLFMPEKEKNLILKSSNKQERGGYEDALQRTKIDLPHFFTYDFFSAEILVKYFQDARNLDFEQVVNTGEYGHRYQQILNGINQILVPGKKIMPQIQSSQAKASEDDPIKGIIFKTDNDEILYSEDLSHGELKRLSLYVWIQYHRMKDAIVLMDEVENGFHPDWQYRIISDLIEWGANNQYILATHSYELCQAVTPAHVKELEPKLLSSE